MRSGEGLTVWPLAVVVFSVGIVAAIAIPGMRRARRNANEASMIGDSRTLIIAQQAYAAVNGGLYDGRLDCLSRPSGCIPGYSPASAAFLDPALASRHKDGYERTFRGRCGETCKAARDKARAAVSKTSIDAWSFGGVPVSLDRTGARSFCSDSAGMICFAVGGVAPCNPDTEPPAVLPNCNVMCSTDPEGQGTLEGRRKRWRMVPTDRDGPRRRPWTAFVVVSKSQRSGLEAVE